MVREAWAGDVTVVGLTLHRGRVTPDWDDVTMHERSTSTPLTELTVPIVTVERAEPLGPGSTEDGEKDEACSVKSWAVASGRNANRTAARNRAEAPNCRTFWNVFNRKSFNKPDLMSGFEFK
jgi:hypothetical protein